MASVDEEERRVALMREYILEDRGMFAGVRTYDAISELLLAILLELRKLNEKQGDA